LVALTKADSTKKFRHVVVFVADADKKYGAMWHAWAPISQRDNDISFRPIF